MITGFVMLTAMTTRASVIETLVMPGKLIDGHAEFESDCSQCHERFDKPGQDRLCLACHEEIAVDVNKKEGFHGRSPVVGNLECNSCHRDHLGRDANVVRLDRQTFNHDLTDFPLKGAHKGTVCELCHQTDKMYRDAPAKCFDCHEDDDTHGGNLGSDCGACHAEQTWTEISFDHDETDFPLRGHHVDEMCNSCHINERYEDTPQECFACHQLDDAHGGLRGKDCGSCHTPHDWGKLTFDHDTETDFALLGRHDQLACAACHKEDPFEVELDMACAACHVNDDEHKGRNGLNCETCHSSEAWKPTIFDHGIDTKFELHNRHAEVPCESCHRGSIADDRPDTRCQSCHGLIDPHAGQLGDDCGRCHNDAGWRVSVFFDHDVTRFPLLGLHATAPCEECHLTPAFHTTPLTCIECHRTDDEHEGTLGPYCAHCHNPNGWSLWQFDHSTQTGFQLDGAHENLDCNACHTVPVAEEINQSMACIACHEQDNIHSGRAWRNCERCHNTKTFNELTIGPGSPVGR